jgi:hypothetical protein
LEWYSYTNNPAYVLLDCLTSSKCLGIADADIDLPAFYLLGTICDELVTDGFGGVEPRYTINNQFTIRENVATFLNYILAVCNANFTSNEFGQLSVFFDRADQPITKQITNANVINGIFKYSSNDVEQRTGLVNVTYSNSSNYGKTDTATWVDQAIIDRFGFQTLDIALVGCTSQAGAIRKARWATYQNAYLTDLVNFSTLHYGMQFHVGELVKVVDNYINGAIVAEVVTSVVVEGINTRLQLDRPLVGTTSVSVITSSGVVVMTVLTLTDTSILVAGIQDIVPNSPLLAMADAEPNIWKVIGVDKSEEVYDITCVIHKYAAVLATPPTPPPSPTFHLLFNTYPLLDSISPSIITNIDTYNGGGADTWYLSTPAFEGAFASGGSRGQVKVVLTLSIGIQTEDFTIRLNYYRTSASIQGYHAIISIANQLSLVAHQDGSFDINGTIFTAPIGTTPIDNYFEVSLERKAGLVYIYFSNILATTFSYNYALTAPYMSFGGNSNAQPSPNIDNVRYYNNIALANGASSYI